MESGSLLNKRGHDNESRSLHINDLPDEILRLVFQYLDGWMGRKRLRQREPHVLADVCRRWRSVTTSIPLLWNKMNYDWRIESGGHAVAQPSSLDPCRVVGRGSPLSIWTSIKSYLSRAWLSLPLYLIFNLSPTQAAAPFAKFLRGISPYIRNLSLSASFSIYLALAMTISTGSTTKARFPQIQFVHLSMPDDDVKWDKPLIRNITSRKTIDFSGCTELCQLYVDSASKSFGFISSNFLSGIPYPQLTHLSIDDKGLSLVRAREIVAQCANLVQCILHINQWEGEGPHPFSSSPHVVLHSLRQLSITFRGKRCDGHVSSFFRPFTFPMLAHLAISAPYAGDHNLTLELIELQIRSKAPITVLNLIEVELHRPSLIRYLSLLPRLQYLRLDAPYNGSCFKYRKLFLDLWLERRSDLKNLLPNLKEIYVTDNFSDSYIARLSRELQNPHALAAFDLSAVLGDLEVLKCVENKCLHDLAEDPTRPLPTLEAATMRWRNLPHEWATIIRSATIQKALLETEYSISVNFPLND
ncbi:hypothetical protein H0H93_011806 [Arthromyces matolae]|nr:hypothetical protein H0H93_011806 [Arthromyces matolae]